MESILNKRTIILSLFTSFTLSCSETSLNKEVVIDCPIYMDVEVKRITRDSIIFEDAVNKTILLDSFMLFPPYFPFKPIENKLGIAFDCDNSFVPEGYFLVISEESTKSIYLRANAMSYSNYSVKDSSLFLNTFFTKGLSKGIYIKN